MRWLLLQAADFDGGYRDSLEAHAIEAGLYDNGDRFFRGFAREVGSDLRAPISADGRVWAAAHRAPPEDWTTLPRCSILRRHRGDRRSGEAKRTLKNRRGSEQSRDEPIQMDQCIRSRICRR